MYTSRKNWTAGLQNVRPFFSKMLVWKSRLLTCTFSCAALNTQLHNDNTTHQAATTHCLTHTLTHTLTLTYTLTRSSLHLSHNSQPSTQNVKFRASLNWSHLPAGVVPDSNSFHQCFRRGPDGGALLPHLHGDCHHSSRRYVHPFSRPPCQCQLVRIAIFKQLMEYLLPYSIV